jgi:hypothetical protein
MAEITRQDLIDDEALKAPLLLAKNLEEAIRKLDELISKSKAAGIKIPELKNLSDASREIDKLAIQQKQLATIMNQVAVAQAKDNDTYREQQKVLQGVKQDLKTKTELEGRSTLEVNKNNASIKQLEAALNANRVAYANLRTEQERSSKTGKELLSVIQKQDKDFKSLSGSIGKNQDNVGNYKSALEGISPQFASLSTGIGNATKAAVTFIATPLGLVIAALGAVLFTLTAYFRSSEEGQNRLNKITAIASAIFEQFMNVVEDVGEAIFDAFTNPKQALLDFGNFIKDQIVNRFVGMFELIPKLGSAVKLLFEGNFKEAGKVAADAIGKVTLGVENATGKLGEFISQTNKIIKTGIDFGAKAAAIQADIDKTERKLIVDRAKFALEVAKLREQSIKSEGEAKRKALTEAIRLETELSNREVAFAQKRLELARLKVASDGNDKEALKAVAEAQADVLNAEKSRFDNTVKFQKQLEALNKKADGQDGEDSKKRIERINNQLEAEIKYFEAVAGNENKSFQERLDAVNSFLDKKQESLDFNLENGLISERQYNLEVISLTEKTTNSIVALIKDRQQKISEASKAEAQTSGDNDIVKLNESLLAKEITIEQYNQSRKDIEERTQAEILKSQIDGYEALKEELKKYGVDLTAIDAAIAAARKTQSDKTANDTIQRQTTLNEKIKELEQVAYQSAVQISQNLFESKNIDLQNELSALEAKYKKDTELAGNNAEAKKRLDAQYVVDQARIQKEIAAQKTKEAIFNKALAVLSIGVSTGRAIAEALPNIPLSIVVGAIGALQLAAVLTKPIPKFEKGTQGRPHEGGLAIVGEKGFELTKLNNQFAITPDKASLVDLPKGAEVFDHATTLKMLATAGIGTSDIKDNGNGYDFNRLERKLDSLENAIKNKKETNINMIKKPSTKMFRDFYN